MAQRCRHLSLLFAILMLVSCQKAQQFPPIVKQPDKADPKVEQGDAALSELSWLEPGERRDLPIEFVVDSNPLWQQLPGYWTNFPLIPTYLGLPPMEALTSVVLADHRQAIKIKVPRGLPDPTPSVPASNPPTYGKWVLGKQLFHERLLPAGADVYSCASCHDPAQRLADGRKLSTKGRYNTPSLINVAFQPRQFWDGRVRTLEETLVRNLDAERKPSEEQALDHHNFGGFVRTLVNLKNYDRQFAVVFGVKHPTQDTVAQALATYMRTILAGDSLYDRADKVRRDKKAVVLSAEHFLEPLKDEIHTTTLYDDPAKKLKLDEAAAQLAKGYELFHGKARCAQCHAGALFTDHDYHNIGIDTPPIGKEGGRAVHVPVGLKEARFVGAYRTPSLRNLVQTAPYFHEGSAYSLANVVEYYDTGVLFAPSLAKALRDGGREQKLGLSAQERDALVLFLRSLEGTPVDAMVAGSK